MSDVTQILSRLDAGESQAAAELLPLVYDELRKLAAAQMVQEKPGQTLQPTALVHEAYLRLVGPAGSAGPDAEFDPRAGSRPAVGTYNSRGHFFAAAAEAMRRILVESARRRASLKRGGQWQRQILDDLPAAVEAADADELLALNEALPKLAAADPIAAQLVNLRYFAGLTTDQAAEMLAISPRTAYYTWNYARSWLHKAISGDTDNTAEYRP